MTSLVVGGRGSVISVVEVRNVSARWGVVGASRGSVVTTGDRLVVGSLVKRAISGMVRGVSSRAGHVGVIAGTVVVGSTGGKSTVASSSSSSGDGSNFGVTKLAVAVLLLPELALARASSVAIGRARAKALLLLVVTTKEHLDGNGQKEEECSDDSDSETSSVQPASSTERRSICDLLALAVAAKALPGVGRSIADRSVDVAAAAVRAIAGENSNGDHCAAAEHVEDQAKQSEDGLSSKAASKENSADGVENSRTGQTLYGLLPAGNVDIAVSLDGKEVRVDSKDDCSTAELQGIECRSKELQRSSAERHCD